MPRVSWEFMGNTVIPLPPFEEQRAITYFLDRKTAQIDELIAKKEALLKKIDEKRTAIITQAVTKGLDLSVPMKDSGIAWIGEIPKLWRLSQLKRIVSVQGRIGFRGYTSEDLVNAEEGAIALGGTNLTEKGHLDLSKLTYLSWAKYEESPEIKVSVNDLLIGQRGTCGNVVIIDKDIGPATINPSLVLLKKPKIQSTYLCYQLMGHFIQSILASYLSTTAVPMLSQQQIGNVPVFIPPINEQITIATYIENKIAIIDRQKAQVSEAIERLKEYRSALITDAVTGKMDVHSIGKKESLST